MILIIYGELYKSWSSPWYSFLQSFVTCCPSNWCMLLSALSSDHLNQSSSLWRRDTCFSLNPSNISLLHILADLPHAFYPQVFLLKFRIHYPFPLLSNVPHFPSVSSSFIGWLPMIERYKLCNSYFIYRNYCYSRGHAVAWLVEALCYKLEGRRFESRVR
jgi:hypothetical protein